MSKDKFRTNKGFNEILKDIAHYNPENKVQIKDNPFQEKYYHKDKCEKLKGKNL